VEELCTLYQQAAELATRGERVLSTDELTGVQALERAARSSSMSLNTSVTAPPPLSSIATWSSGQVVAPSCGPTRTAADFRDHIMRTVATDPAATRWHVVVDNLNIHTSTAPGALCG